MDKKVTSAIVSILVVTFIALSVYGITRFNDSCADLEQYEDIKNYIEEIETEVNDVYDVSEPEYVSYEVPETRGFKSYMDYKAIKSVTSPQYVLQHEYAYTGNYGIRMVNDRYCIALGSHFTTDVGRYVDLVLENGTVIPCILADQKADIHTDENNIITVANGCASEFVVNTDLLDYLPKVYGDISWCTDEWRSRVIEVRVYDDNIFDM